MTRQWYLAFERRPVPGHHYGEKLRYVITDGEREHVMHAFLGAYFVARLKVAWRNVTAVPSIDEIRRRLRMEELEARKKELEMATAVRQFELEMAK